MSQHRQYRAEPVVFLLVLAAALMLGSLFIPRVLHSEVTAGENSAIATLINISEAQNAYRDRYPAIGFAPELAALATVGGKKCVPSPQQACLLDQEPARASSFRGYSFAELAGTQVPHVSYSVTAAPLHYGRTGVRTFCVTEHGVPRYKDFGGDFRATAITRDQCLNDFAALP